MLRPLRPTLALAGLAALASCALAQNHGGTRASGQMRAEAPNVVVIVLDDVGTDKLALYGPLPGFAAHTPVLDALAAGGILFTNAYGNPVCGPSRAALMTGRHGFRTGFGSNVRNPGGFGLPDAELGLGELVRASGSATYAAGAFGKWHLAVRGDEEHPLRAMGFDRFYGQMGNVDGKNLYGAHNYVWRLVDARPEGVDVRLVQGPPWDTTTWATSVQRHELSAWVAEQDGPFLAYWSPPSPHGPLQPPPHELLSPETIAGVPRGFPLPLPAYDGSDDELDPLRERQYYDAMLEATDTEIGLFLASLGPRLADTWVIVYGDNGAPAEAFAPPYDPNHAKGSVYQQGVHVPLIVLGPGVVAPGRSVPGPVHAVDLWATVRTLTYASPELDGRTIDGTSLTPIFANPFVQGTRRRVLCEVFAPSGFDASGEIDPDEAERCYTDGVHKYVWRRIVDEAGAPRIEEELYDLVADPLEVVDLADGSWTAAQHDVFLDLRSEMNRLLQP